MVSHFLNDLSLGRRSALTALAGAGLGAAGVATAHATSTKTDSIDYTKPADNLYAFGKIWSTYADKPAISAFHGLMYMRIGDQRMIPMFGYVGTGVLHAKFDEKTGTLIRKSRETGYFTDLKTGEILEMWKNPFTDETVPVYHFYNDLAAFKMSGTTMPQYALGKGTDKPTIMNEGTSFADENGNIPLILPFQQLGADHMMLSWDYTHDYTNPVTPEGWPTYSTGARITPSEHFTLNFSKRELEDRSLPSIRHVSGFTRLSQPWPFMKMGGDKFKGATVFGRSFSHKGLKNYDEVPRKLLDYVEKHAPRYLELPPGWDIVRSDRLDTWMAFAQDVPAENKNYPWKKTELSKDVAPPTGLGSVLYK
ncbi:MAG: DUF1838 family protein [Rhodospirillaceae bacterium]|nr:DUF1838 family protein [Rhodospirillaceae bacterium]